MNQALHTVIDHWGLTLTVVAALSVLACWFAYRAAVSARSGPEIETGKIALRPEAAAEVFDLTARPPRPDLRRSFARAKNALKRAFPGGGSGYERPWVLALGPALSGRSTLLEKSRLALPFGQPRQKRSPGHPGINWWAFEGGVVLDIVGEDILRPDGLSSDQIEWQAILRNLRRSRRRRPIDGVVLTLPAYYFLDDKKPLAQRLSEASRRGILLQRKLAEAQRVLCMRFPVFLLISHCDLIPGFPALLDPELGGPSLNHQQMLGWSNPASPAAPYSGAWLTQAFELLHKELEAWQLNALAAPAPAGLRSKDVVLLPKRLRDLAEPLGVYANHLFSPNAGSEPSIFRGVYLCGGGGADPSSETAVAGRSNSTSPSEVVFVGDLFNRKVFPEAGLAQPTERVVFRARAWRAALATVALGSLIWGAFGYWRGADTAREAASKEAPFLGLLTGKSAAASGECSPEPGSSTGQLARNVLACGGGVSTFQLRTLALPGAWLSGLPGRRDRLVDDGLKKMVFEPILSVLNEKTEALIQANTDGEVADDGTGVLAFDKSPQFQQLDQLTQELAKLDRTIAAYQSFSSGDSGPAEGRIEQFGQLTAATLGARLEPASRGAAAFFNDRLRGVGVAGFDYGHDDFNQRLEKKVLGMAKGLFDDLYTRNLFLADLTEIESLWPGAGSDLEADHSDLDVSRQLQESLDRARKDLDLPEVQWTAADSPDLGPRFDEIVSRIQASPFLGTSVADEIRRMARGGFLQLQGDLAAVTAGGDTPLLTRADQKWQLTADPLAVLAALDALLGESFITRRCQAWPSEQYWNPAPLKEALDLYSAYQNWLREGKLPAPLEDIAPVAAGEAIGNSIACRIAEAEPSAFPAGGSGPGQLENGIWLQVRNLKTVEASLQSLFGILGDLRLASDQGNLAGLIRKQRQHILKQLDQLRGGLNLYPTAGAFNSWQGEPGPALVAFDQKSTAELTGYLKTQRQIITRLSTEYAQPVLAMFAGSNQPALAPPPAADWQRIASDLSEYTDKQPGNAVASLEDFVTAVALNEPPKVFDLYSCFSAFPAAAPNGSDFFLEKRTALRSALRERCLQLADEKGYQQYTVLAKVFNQRLWSHFPFSPPQASGSAAPDDIRAFYQAEGANFNDTLILINNLPNPSKYFGDQKQDVQDFMKQMDAVQKFFASFLAPEAKSPNPIYDLSVRFRVDRAREAGANQIISWLMSVGEPAQKGEPSQNGEKVIDLLNTGSVSPAPDAKDPSQPDGRWLFGKPVTLSFGWATGSPFSPYVPSSTSTPGRPVVDGRTLVYKFREPWSLLRLLIEYHAPNSEFPDLTDPNPQTVKLSIDTVADASPDAPREVATVYLRITLRSPDGKQILPLPQFPSTQAPLVGAGTAGAAPRKPAPAASGEQKSK